jgi:hypothetical protein
MRSLEDAWPPLTGDVWAPTKRSLHMYAQMLGKLRLALSPFQPNFTFTALTLTPRGFTTGVMPYDGRSIAGSLDVLSAELVVESSDGERRRISVATPCTIARVFSAFENALADMGVAVSLSPVPQELADVTPFDLDERPALWNADAAREWLTAVTTINAVFDRWRSHFAGRMGIYLWWGALDLSLLLFSGKSTTPPLDRGYLLKYDLDAEMMSVGFYPGDQASPAVFYGYIVPQPAGSATLPILPEGAAWSDAAGEWILPYDVARASANPESTLSSFLDSIYSACGYAAGWDRDRFRYTPPPLRRAKPSTP